MGKPAGRLGDIGSGHDKCPPTPIISGSGDVSVNGRPAARVGDSLIPHCRHTRAIAVGSSSVTINGRPAARIGDAINCGGNVSTGSSDVFIGDAIVLTSPSDASLPDIVFPSQQRVTAKNTPIQAHRDSAMAASDLVRLSDQDRHAQCNIDSAKAGAPFLQGAALNK